MVAFHWVELVPVAFFVATIALVIWGLPRGIRWVRRQWDA